MPYDLTNKAELLLQLGLKVDADAAMSEVEEGIRRKVDGYVGRQRRVTFQRLLSATIDRRFLDAVAIAGRIAPGGADSAAALGPILQRYAEARLRPSAFRVTPVPAAPSAASGGPLRRESSYWRAAIALETKQLSEAFAIASQGLESAKTIGNDELRWRFAAIAAIAAQELGRAEAGALRQDADANREPSRIRVGFVCRGVFAPTRFARAETRCGEATSGGTMKNQKVLIGAGIVVVAPSAVAAFWLLGADEEAPIIVKNGSMTVETASPAEWADSGGQWTHDSKKTHGGELWVKILVTNGPPCTGSGHPVHVDFSQAGFQANFNVAGNGSSTAPYRTVVTPRGQLDKESPIRLRHGTAGTGYITGVKIGSNDLNCGITQANLNYIAICSSPNVDECQ